MSDTGRPRRILWKIDFVFLLLLLLRLLLIIRTSILTLNVFSIYTVMRWAGHVGRMGDERGVYRVLVGKPEGRRPLGRPRRRWVDNIGMDLQEGGMWACGLDWAGPG